MEKVKLGGEYLCKPLSNLTELFPYLTLLETLKEPFLRV